MILEPRHYTCLVCGTICLVTRTLFLGLPDRWYCPVCDASGTLAAPNEGQASVAYAERRLAELGAGPNDERNDG